MFERPRSGERAVLVHLNINGAKPDGQQAEFNELVCSAGAYPVATLSTSRKAPDARFLVGSGKVAEIEAAVRESHAEVVLVDHELSPAQERNLEKILQCRVLDRVGLILDIFAQRASSFEGKLQVELAQLSHLSTRLVRGWTHLERQKGGIGLRGPGEKQLETDRRLLSERIKTINRRLDRVEKRRGLSRKSRNRAELPLIALVGYTNAGKSTLFNALTGADVGAADRLFQTLDPTLRRLDLGGQCRAVAADTVGFIRDLPHDLVAAFRATLEETRNATLLAHVVDTSDPNRRQKMQEVDTVLREIGGEEIPQLVIYNKIDKLPSSDGHVLARVDRREAPESDKMVDELAVPDASRASARIDRDASGMPVRVWLSAREPGGLELLRQALVERVGPTVVRRKLRLPLSAGRLRARLFELGTVLHESADTNGEILLDVEISKIELERLCRSEGLESRYIAA